MSVFLIFLNYLNYLSTCKSWARMPE